MSASYGSSEVHNSYPQINDVLTVLSRHSCWTGLLAHLLCIGERPVQAFPNNLQVHHLI